MNSNNRLTVNERLIEFKLAKSANCLPRTYDEWVRICFNDPLRSAGSNRRLLLEQESELDPEPFLNLREECET
jgi:hypothetical protein